MKTYNIEYTANHLEQLCDLVTESKEKVILERPGKEDVILVAESDLESIEETLYLLSPPANAQALFEAIEKVTRNKLEPQTIDDLMNELGFEEEN